MGATARFGLILAMMALLCAGQLLEREFAARRAAEKARRESAPAPYAALLAPLPEVAPPPRPRGEAPGGEGGDPAALPAAARPSETVYVVQAGDSLGKIARRFYGNEAHWRAILDRNKDEIPDPGRLQVGASLHIPARERVLGR
jgi:nucleoid-associated protein YgaU